MSNLTVILTSVLISFISCAIFMSSYKEDQKEDKGVVFSNLGGLWKLIRNHGAEIDILRARVYDLENKLKEMEKLDDGK